MAEFQYGDKVVWTDPGGTTHLALVVNVIELAAEGFQYALFVPGRGVLTHSVRAAALAAGWKWSNVAASHDDGS